MVFGTRLMLSLLFRSVIRGTVVIITFDVTVTRSDTGTGQLFITLLKLLQVGNFYSFDIFYCFDYYILLID